MPDPLTENPLISSIFWPTGTGGPEELSPEQLKQRRAIAAALASRSRPYPTTIGQGIASLGESFGDAMYERGTQQYEAAQRDLDRRAARDASGGAVTTPPPPPVPRGRTSAVTEEAVKTAAALDEQPNPVSTMVAAASPASRADLARSVLTGRGVAPPGAAGVPPEPIPSQPPAAPLRTRYAALNPGTTMSNAGQPGTTYGGPSPAGPGASLAEPPDTSPPTPSASPSAPPGPVGTPAPGVAGGGPEPVPRAALAGPVMAQAGVTPPRSTTPPRITAPGSGSEPPIILPAPGASIGPPTSQVPVGPAIPPPGYTAPGETYVNKPTDPGPRPDQPRIGVDTPEMARIKSMLADERYRNISPSERSRWTGILERMTTARDKQDAENLDAWRRKDAAWFTDKKKFDEDTQNFPKTVEESRKARDEAVDRQRFGSPDNKKKIEDQTYSRAETARTLAKNLPALYRAEQLLKSGKVITGYGTSGYGGVNLPFGIGNVSIPGKMTMTQFLADWVGGSATDEAAATEEYRSLMRSQIAAVIKANSGANPSNIELSAAEQQIGLNNDITRESMLRTINRLRTEAIKAIHDHNAKTEGTWKDRIRDEAIRTEAKVDVPFDPIDVRNLKGMAGTIHEPELRRQFDKIYGVGAAFRALKEGN